MRGQSVVGTVPGANDQGTGAAAEPAAKDVAAQAATAPAAERPVARPTLDELPAKLEVPPPWLDGVSTQWDTCLLFRKQDRSAIRVFADG